MVHELIMNDVINNYVANITYQNRILHEKINRYDALLKEAGIL